MKDYNRDAKWVIEENSLTDHTGETRFMGNEPENYFVILYFRTWKEWEDYGSPTFDEFFQNN